jgi:hypothetical protein
MRATVAWRLGADVRYGAPDSRGILQVRSDREMAILGGWDMVGRG